jgi:hypothetical protein
MWYVEVMVRGIFIQRPMLRDVVVAGVGCVLNFYRCSSQIKGIRLAIQQAALLLLTLTLLTRSFKL